MVMGGGETARAIGVQIPAGDDCDDHDDVEYATGCEKDLLVDREGCKAPFRISAHEIRIWVWR